MGQGVFARDILALAVLAPGCLGGPQGGPPQESTNPGSFVAAFELVDAPSGALSVRVNTTERVFAVDFREGGGGWRAMTPRGDGVWVWEGALPEDSALVEIRARSHAGAIALSKPFSWAARGGPGDDSGADVLVVVRASEGPHGRAQPARIDRRFYGMNVADWRPQDYSPQPNATYLAYLKALDPGILRWPAGHTSQEHVWERAPEGTAGAKRVLTAAHVDAFVRLARAAGAEPLIAVNVKTGSPEAAADLVRYANVEKGYGVRWWQIGNEPDHKDGLTRGPEAYAQQVVAFSRAMRAVDPSIKLVGGEILTGARVLGTNGAKDWMTPILEAAGGHLDAISWHYYPLDSNQPSRASSAYPTLEHLYQETASDWRPAGLSFADEIFPHLAGLRDQHAPRAQLWVTEFAEDSGMGGAPGISDRHAGALWAADALGRFAAHGPGALVKFLFASTPGHSFTLLDEQRNPRPAYYTYWLYANHFGDRIVHASSNATRDVNAHAALRSEDGALVLVLVNKQPEPRVVHLALHGYPAPPRAERYLLRADAYDAVAATINGETLGVRNLHLGRAAIPPLEAPASRDALLHLPPLSVTLIVYRPP